MKKLIILTALLAFAGMATPVFAHCGKCGVGDDKKVMDVDAKVEKLTKKLGLSEDQANKLKPVLQEKMDKKKALYEKKKADMQALHDDYQAKLKGILTPEQLSKYEAMKEGMMEHKGSMMDGHKGSMDMEGMHEHKGSH
jgi:hypothetical protein